MTSLHTLIDTLDNWMRPDLFDDYAPNGLQVEGRGQINRIAVGVTASAQVIEEAVNWKADALLVHHGYFWRGESPNLTGMKGRRLKRLFENQMSLIAYHLPLDCHSEFGNNKALLDQIGLQGGLPIASENGLMWSVELKPKTSLSALSNLIATKLNREPLVISSPIGSSDLCRLVLCTGGAQDYLTKAHALGADVYLSGEISERTTHEARELGVHYIAAGHHATERYGVQELARKLELQLGLQTMFFDDHNPA